MGQKGARIAYQGEPGAFSDHACRDFAKELLPLPCPTFERAFAAVERGEAEAAMVPVENVIAGRVDEVFRLLPDMPLAIQSEHFLPVKMQLMTLPDAEEASIKVVRSHPMALRQCRRMIARRDLVAEVAPDTAGAARALAEDPEEGVAVIAPEVAASHYGLKIIERDVQDLERNFTRFLKLVPVDEAVWPDLLSGAVMTSLVFRVRNIPAALYKALGGFATNGVNMHKLESYQDPNFSATQFLAEIEGHPDDPPVARALEELGYFSTDLKLLGVFAADPARAQSFNS